MPGYSNFADKDPIHEAPMQRLHWVSGSFRYLAYLKVQSTLLPRMTMSLYTNLVSMNVSQGWGPMILCWGFFELLFTEAQSLRHPRLAEASPFFIPSYARLRSVSLLVLDMSLDQEDFASYLMQLMEVPNLQEITLHVTPSNLERVLQCLPLFSNIVQFCLHGELGYGHALYPLFDSIYHLQVLDLENAHDHTFTAYCQWTYDRVESVGGVRGHRLRSLVVGMVDVLKLSVLVKFYKVCGESSGTHLILKHLQLDSRIATWEEADMDWLRLNVADYGVFVDSYAPVCPYSGPTLYSLFVFY
jgi:hypothetical protein